MTESPRERTEALRDEMFVALQEVELFRAVQALDDAVCALGGQRRITRQGSGPERSLVKAAWRPREGVPANQPGKPLTREVTRLSQPDAAEMVLREAGVPLPVRDLLPLIEAKGVTMNASDPIASLGSQLSRNPDRFESIRLNNIYHWWIKGQDFPPSWNETTDPDLLAESAASSLRSNQEGGDGREANNTP
jgi:hypothetical protein